MPPQGVELATMEALVRYWGTEYDLRRVETRLNALPQFLTEIDDLDIHFIHVKSRHENALPMILVHGWPGSVVELLSVVGPLTDPTAHGGRAEDAFDVVIPSIPGYGFSGKPTTSGWRPERVASASIELMKRLGYTRFVAQGGDWGAVIVDLMGVQAPPELLGIHSNMPGVLPPEIAAGFAPLVVAPAPAGLSAEEQRCYEQVSYVYTHGIGYAIQMLLHPQTLYGIADSPAGLGRLDGGPRRTELPGHHQGVRRRTARGQPDPRRGARQHHTDVVHEHRGLLGPVVPRELLWLLRRQGRVGAGRGDRVPEGALPGSAQLGRARVPQPDLLQRGRSRLSFRGLAGAATVLRRGPRRIPVAAVKETMFEWSPMPPLAGAAEWLNSEPLGPAELRGHVVLVNFWTLTCINWLRQEPYVRAWSQAYRADRLIVIGVHTPEFSFEHEIADVRRSIEEREIDYPVAVDNDYVIWSAFDNRYWPALYFVDADGIIRGRHFGEGRYEQSERLIQRLLGIDRELVTVEGRGVEAAADWNHLRTPETYLGYGRSDRFSSPNGVSFDRRRAYELPDSLRVNHWALQGDWTIGAESAVLCAAGGSIAYRFHARDAHLVLSPGAREPMPFHVILDGRAPGPSHGVDVSADGNGVLRDGRMYQLVRQHDTVRERTLEITFRRVRRQGVRVHLWVTRKRCRALDIDRQAQLAECTSKRHVRSLSDKRDAETLRPLLCHQTSH